MSSLKVLSPQENLIEAVASELLLSEMDYANHIVIFPGKRPSHFLRKLLADKEKRSFYPPKVFSIDEFVTFLFSELLKYRQQALQTIDAVAILYDVHKKTEKKLGHTFYDAFESFFPVALKLYSELEEVMMGNQPPSRVKEVLQNVDYSKFHSLAQYYERFYEEVKSRGCVTRAMIYQTVAEEIERINISSYERIVFAGFYAFTNVEKKIVGSLREKSNICFIFQAGKGLSEQMQLIGFDVEDIEEKIQPKAELHFYKAPDTHGQVYALASEIKKRIDNGDKVDHNSAVILPTSGALFPTVHFLLSILDEYNIALGYSVKRTPAYGIINNLLDLFATSFNNQFTVRSYLKFILHPYVKNIRFQNRSDVTRIIFHTYERYLAEKKSKSLVSIEWLEDEDELFIRCKESLKGIIGDIGLDQIKNHVKTIHRHTIRKLQNIKSLGDFSQKLIDVLNYIFENSTASLHPYFQPYVEKLIEVLSNVTTSLIKDEVLKEKIGYQVFLRDLLESETVPFSGTPLRGLQVLGLLETRNLSFNTIYFLDATDDIIPGKPGDDMLLPQQIRKMLGLETYREREKLIEYYFDLAINSSQEVHLFYTENQKDGKKEKSRFVQKLLWNKQQEKRNIKTNEFENLVRYSVQLENRKPNQVKKTEDIINYLRVHNISSSQLDSYLSCQLKFYYQYVLQLFKKSEVSEEMDVIDIGTLVHSILEEYFRPFIGRKIDNLDKNFLVNVITKKFTELYGDSSNWLGPTILMHTQFVNHLWEFIEKYEIPKLRTSETILIDLEKKISIEVNGIKFTGKIDRIEKRNGKVFIIDYKTSKDDSRIKIRLDKLDTNDRETYREAIGSFQLPMYMLLYQADAKTSIENIIPSYLFLGKTDIDEKIEIPMGDKNHSPGEVFNSVRQVIFKLIDEILDIDKPFTPTEFLEEECSKCEYSTICGTMWTRGRNNW